MTWNHPITELFYSMALISVPWHIGNYAMGGCNSYSITAWRTYDTLNFVNDVGSWPQTNGQESTYWLCGNGKLGMQNSKLRFSLPPHLGGPMFAEAESRPRDDLIFRSRISHIQVCEETKFGKFLPPTPKYEKNFFSYNESCMRNTFSGQS